MVICGISWLTQIVIPCILGGIISLLRFSFQDKNWKSWEGIVKHFLSGAIAGMVAVNMFNPKGSFDQVVVISVFAGTHGMAWILSNSFMSSRTATDTINELYEQDKKTLSTILDASVDESKDVENVENMLSLFLNESHEDEKF